MTKLATQLLESGMPGTDAKAEARDKCTAAVTSIMADLSPLLAKTADSIVAEIPAPEGVEPADFADDVHVCLRQKLSRAVMLAIRDQ